MLKRMNKEKYVEFWERSSIDYEEKGIYEQLSQITPCGKTLEIGCGVGLSTASLSKKRKVLSIDNNILLIQKARLLISKRDLNAEIIESDVFEPSEECIEKIKSFQPKVITGWFLGSHADDQEKRVSNEYHIGEKAKTYREKIEDILTENTFCIQSVDWIHTVFRGGAPSSISKEELKKAMKDEYNNYMFSNSVFSVYSVEIIDCDLGSFPYVTYYNPNISPTDSVKPIIVSVLAKRN